LSWLDLRRKNYLPEQPALNGFGQPVDASFSAFAISIFILL
jgi:hypothetical protein